MGPCTYFRITEDLLIISFLGHRQDGQKTPSTAAASPLSYHSELQLSMDFLIFL